MKSAYTNSIEFPVNSGMDAKQAAAYRAMTYVQPGMIVGLGTGSTAYWAIQRAGEMVRNGFNLTAIPTSNETEKLATELGIPLLKFDGESVPDIDIDGADEVDEQLNLVKGGGGALLREKIIAFASKRFIVIIDESKLVEKVGKFPLAVEIKPRLQGFDTHESQFPVYYR